VNEALRALTRREKPRPDYTPRDMGEARELEELFGDQLAVGHSINEAAEFLVLYAREGIQ
jgi:hypothetical protein